MAVSAGYVLPPEAYAPIHGDAADRSVSNIPTVGAFVGRQDELDALDAAFAESGGVVLRAVHGMGGVGKSALAARWASERSGATVRWWITADSPAAVDAGLAALAVALQPGLGGLPAELQTERALQWLVTQPGWLLVLDNVEDPGHIRRPLDRAPAGRFLVTTRGGTGWRNLAATTVRLGVFEPGESVELFTRVLTHDRPRDATGADRVCEELGHLALAVEQAAAFCAASGTTPDGFLAMFHDAPAEVIDAADETDAGLGARRTVARIWRLTLDRITADTPLAADVLRVLAWYAPDHIPRDLIDDLAPAHALARALARLTAYNLVTDHGDGTLAVHRLVQTIARTPDPHDPHRNADDIHRARDTATTSLEAAFPGDCELPEHWPRYRILLPHADALTHAAAPDTDTTDTADLLDCTAEYRLEQGALAAATAAFERALAARYRLLGADHPDTLISRNNVAYAYAAAGDLGRAIPLSEQNLEDRTRVLGADHRHTLTSRKVLAHAYELAGDLGRAIPLFEQTLDECVRVFGNDDPYTVTSRNNLALAYAEAGDLARAVPLYEQTLDEFVRLLGNDHPYTLISRNNLANAYAADGDLERAVPLFEQTLADRSRVLGEDHPHTLASCNGLAGAYQSAGDLGRAVALYEQNLANVLRVLGKEHPHTLISRSNLANAYKAAGDLGRAIALYEQNLTDRARALGNDHPDTLDSRDELAKAYKASGDVGRVVTLYEQTLADRTRALGADHRETMIARLHVAHAYEEAGDTGRAIALYEQTLAALVRVLGEDHSVTGIVRNLLEGVRSGRHSGGTDG
ncbi:tetratricopeptide repeat protein [Yinghuangia seranimata]|uniref:tetratricopeptide repeat protein n=1 Tax=Yinghuangia seranimata TaxID=408067 RepID=UPI00248CE239|nr:tetratricopeptide repeat protein [Yinghuangia seranimata]MDI2129643.1 tetratricopeptide repeat protein [Yinghuangia seranimata]